MDPIIILIANGFALSLLLLILLIVMASKNNRPVKRNRIKVKDDLKKIKEQISSQEDESED
ncbi:MAG: hypothetical protein Q7S27_01470 [Nanoarchaeota archaeon]|nr:hypothetical protein [Nanoarchaeota archaeon]